MNIIHTFGGRVKEIRIGRTPGAPKESTTVWVDVSDEHDSISIGLDQDEFKKLVEVTTDYLVESLSTVVVS